MIKFYEGPYHQQGAGFGGFLSGLFKFIKPITNFLRPIVKSPFAQKIAREVVDTGKTIGKEVLSDVISGVPFSTSAKQNLSKAKKRVAQTVLDSINSGGRYEEDENGEYTFKKTNEQVGGYSQNIKRRKKNKPLPKRRKKNKPVPKRKKIKRRKKNKAVSKRRVPMKKKRTILD